MKISELMEEMIIEADTFESTDIHFHPSDEKVQIYYRIMDKLIFQENIKHEKYQKIIRYIKFKSRLDISMTKHPQDGAFTINTKNDEKIFIRISTIPLLNNESLVIRLLHDQEKLNFKEIAYNENDVLEMYEVINNENGLFIFTGPTGSGKTTTMYTILNHLADKNNKKILTIENPIEIVNNNFTQVQINEDMNITYPICLKAALRQDPDLIMIGEIRDEETARNVFRAALTGHTVISTMHTKNLYGVVERFKDFGFLQSEIESVLIGISNQRLISNQEKYVKSFYDYVCRDKLKMLIRKEIIDEGIEKKIKKKSKYQFVSKKT